MQLEALPDNFKVVLELKTNKSNFFRHFQSSFGAKGFYPNHLKVVWAPKDKKRFRKGLYRLSNPNKNFIQLFIRFHYTALNVKCNRHSSFSTENPATNCLKVIVKHTKWVIQEIRFPTTKLSLLHKNKTNNVLVARPHEHLRWQCSACVCRWSQTDDSSHLSHTLPQRLTVARANFWPFLPFLPSTHQRNNMYAAKPNQQQQLKISQNMTKWASFCQYAVVKIRSRASKSRAAHFCMFVS